LSKDEVSEDARQGRVLERAAVAFEGIDTALKSSLKRLPFCELEDFLNVLWS